jgi:hypothetical protein
MRHPLLQQSESDCNEMMAKCNGLALTVPNDLDFCWNHLKALQDLVKQCESLDRFCDESLNEGMDFAPGIPNSNCSGVCTSKDLVEMEGDS